MCPVASSSISPFLFSLLALTVGCTIDNGLKQHGDQPGAGDSDTSFSPDTSDTEDALRRNRRIELKLTNR